MFLLSVSKRIFKITTYVKKERKHKERERRKKDYISREIDPQDATLIARGVVHSNCDVTLFYCANNNASTLKA
jgi:hypothetical protein